MKAEWFDDRPDRPHEPVPTPDDLIENGFGEVIEEIDWDAEWEKLEAENRKHARRMFWRSFFITALIGFILL